MAHRILDAAASVSLNQELIDMDQNREKTSQQTPTHIPVGVLARAQKVFAEVVGRELARLWIEQQSPALNEGSQRPETRWSPQNQALESS